MSEASLAALITATPGFQSVVVRAYGPTGDMRWFERMDSKERGAIITAARSQQP